jgi:predicted  nucleic acid-binding Zn-ribbon protein
MKRIILASILFATPALAQQPSLMDQLNAASAEVTTTISNLRTLIIQNQNQIGALRSQNAVLEQQVAAVTKERDELKAKALASATPDKD